MNPPQSLDRSDRLRAFAATDAVLIGAALLLTLVCALTVERVPVAGGFGWDGIRYAAWARNFHDEVFVKGVDSYYIQRVLPSAVVHYGLRLSRVPPTDAAILRAFDLYAVAMLTLAAWAWCGIARTLRLSTPGRWLGFIGLFVNYIALRYVFYVPPGTESTAYALGTLMLWCYLRDHRATLTAVIAVGAFDWPACLQVGALLLVFPHNDAPPRRVEPLPRWVPATVTALLVLVVGIGIATVVAVPPTLATAFVDSQFGEPNRSWLAVSIVVALAYLGGGAYALLDDPRWYDPRWLLGRRHVESALLVAVGAESYVALQRHLSTPASFDPLSVLLRQTAYVSVVEPGVFLVTHAVFYGPMFLLTLMLWRSTCRHLHSAGFGLTLAVFFGLLLSLNSQSRFVINIFPMLLPFVVRAADDRRWGAAPYVVIGLAGLAASKVWFTINSGPFHGRLHEFPDQGFFMAHGPWISPAMYGLQGVLTLLVASVMWWVCVRSGRSAVDAPPG